MSIQIILFLLSFAAPESFSNVNKSKQDLTTAYHYHNNILVNNFDGSRSTIYIGGNSATLINADGTQSTIDFYGKNSSTLIAIDGSSSSVTHHGLSSTILNYSDGSRIITNHMRTTSSCSTENGSHTIMHTFGFSKEMRHKKEVDVLIHMNWMKQKKMAETMEGYKKEEDKK